MLLGEQLEANKYLDNEPNSRREIILKSTLRGCLTAGVGRINIPVNLESSSCIKGETFLQRAGRL
jgi:hypothetical protein